MKSAVTSNISKSANLKEKNYAVKFNLFFLQPLSSGLFGFALFFTILIVTKLLASFLNTGIFFVDFDDVILSSIGFILMFLIKLLENIAQNKTA